MGRSDESVGERIRRIATFGVVFENYEVKVKQPVVEIQRRQL